MAAKVFALVQVRVPPPIKEWLEAQATTRDLSMNAAVCAILTEAKVRDEEHQLAMDTSHVVMEDVAPTTPTRKGRAHARTASLV